MRMSITSSERKVLGLMRLLRELLEREAQRQVRAQRRGPLEEGHWWVWGEKDGMERPRNTKVKRQ